MDNRKKKKSKGERPSGNQNTIRHISFDEVSVPQVNEPMPVCSICGKNIETIADAISEGNGSYSHFDCVIAKIREQERVTENETVSYIGHGNFAVLYKDEEGKYVIKTRIPYESKENYDSMKKYVESTKI
jgi:transcription elongation factor Elf1